MQTNENLARRHRDSRRRILSFVAAVAFLANFAFAQQATLPTFADVSYGSHPLETMDVYLHHVPGMEPVATHGTKPKGSPVVIEIHAGGWAGGFKSFFPLYGGLIEEVQARGFAVVSINYPLAPQDPYPASNLSCQRAVQFVRSKAQAWGIDPTRIVVLGCSSGAHLAMWVAMSADVANPASPDPVLKQSSRVSACISYEGPSDLTDEYYHYDTSVGHGTISPVWQYFNVYTQQDFDTLIPLSAKQQASPRWLVQNGAGPVENSKVHFLAIFGDANPLITSSSQLTKPDPDLHSQLQGLIIADALKTAGNTDVQLWFGPTGFISGSGPGTGLLAAEAGADWLATRFQGTSLTNFGYGTPGCFSNQLIEANSLPHIGNSNFEIRTYNALPNSTGTLVLGHILQATEIDPVNIGVKLLFNLGDPALTSINFVSDANGTASATIPIPSSPSVIGQKFYAQGLWPWTGAGAPANC